VQAILGWTESITIDSHLAVEDLWGSLSHVSMLGHQGIIPVQAASAILPALLKFQDDFISGAWKYALLPGGYCLTFVKGWVTSRRMST
jgi:argininosuccinate lyase